MLFITKVEGGRDMTQIRCRCGNSVEIDDTLPFVRAKCFQCGYVIRVEFEEPPVKIPSFSEPIEALLGSSDDESDGEDEDE